MKWEYLTYLFGEYSSTYNTVLDNFGKRGWELVLVDNGIAYFKRPLRTKSEAEILAHFDYPQQDRSSEV